MSEETEKLAKAYYSSLQGLNDRDIVDAIKGGCDGSLLGDSSDNSYKSPFKRSEASRSNCDSSPNNITSKPFYEKVVEVIVLGII